MGDNMTKKEAGKLGGLACMRTHGRAHMQSIGRKGAQTTWRLYCLLPIGIGGYAMVDRITHTIKAIIPG